MGRQSSLFSADLVHLDGNAIVVLLGELDLDTVPDVEHVVDQLIEDGPDEVIFDLSGLSFMDSSGIAVLISTQESLHSKGRRLTVRSPQPRVLKVLEVTSLIDYLNVQTAQSAK